MYVQLLYVYINDYQSGGYMWYAVFNGSMVALIAGVLTLLGYLGIREVFFSGPFYLLAPLPLFLSYFWYKCEDRFKAASMVRLHLCNATARIKLSAINCNLFTFLNYI